MAIQNTDLLVINRAGVDYKADVAKLKIPTDNKDLVNGAGYITSAQIPPCDFTGLATSEELTTEEEARIAEDLRLDAAIKTLESGEGPDLSEYATETWVEGKGYITLSEVPDPVLEGALVFKGNVESEAALPGDAAVGDIYFNETDNHMYAWGEDDAWHKLNTIEDVDLSEYAKLEDIDLSEYAKLDDDSQEIVAGTITSKTGEFGTEGEAYMTFRPWSGLDVAFDDGNQTSFVVKPDGCYYYSHDKKAAGFFIETNIECGETVKAASFEGDGSKLTNLPVNCKTIDELPELPA